MTQEITAHHKTKLKIYMPIKPNKWPAAKIAIFFKSPNIFFIIYIKLSRKFGQVLMYKAAIMTGNHVNAFEVIFGHLNNN